MSDFRYDPQEIEPRWQRLWAQEHTWEVDNAPVGGASGECAAPKAYVLEMLPYPSGEPHIGHLKCYSVGDAIAHFHRRTGPSRASPDGLRRVRPARREPRDPHRRASARSTAASIASFQRQFRRWGISIDWSRELATHEPSYYRWTQWIFLSCCRPAWPTASRPR